MKYLSESSHDPVCINFLDKFQDVLQEAHKTPLSPAQAEELGAAAAFLKHQSMYAHDLTAYSTAMSLATRHASNQFINRARTDGAVFEPHEIRLMRRLEATLVRINPLPDYVRRAELSYIFDCSVRINPATENPVYSTAAFMALYMRPDNVLNRDMSG